MGKIIIVSIPMVLRGTVVAMIALAALVAANPVVVGATCTSSGVPTVTTDKSDYEPGETAIIVGEGFDCSATLAIEVVRPDGTVVTGDGSGTPGPDTVTTNEIV